ncbi:probable bifunctional dTTP/UTP pyrophosphatase/methyltransferase protein isoform X1 [Phodopus roborovskii]|uniref:probable bifunctional dTTP/UTP pyrophosphatase/methyltransferase protein isoform X1 n=1 Tax=Phodopus roborovskii TaxID=109678 RepID=UPI0021E50C9B|nr:probable bifunctional dTTP/UTP pyrophosphatase/methyltransferase protein isoform X1 [Phodopus roborovskii]XP_051030919.1 probable bifunctional dTTP/UTP pyrophosphatase/methyltransferase protein isoform X1 [Phodopus roborovskii]XP_051030920.1 probable bifunctional dTTP/UTP pyrophosphatase/methyltransferase protein isoform X1 [Phodopus roborovskii]
MCDPFNMELVPLTRLLQGKRVVLASSSPRRRDILSSMGLQFEVVPSHFQESLEKARFPAPPEYARETAKLKALEVASRLRRDLHPPDVIIGADTIVAVDGVILEKPKDKDDAYRMLRRLSGQQHSVITGVAILRPLWRRQLQEPSSTCPEAPEAEGDPEAEVELSLFHEETRVTFSRLSEPLLCEYVESGEPLDKAGAYGLQARGGALAERVEGDFFNAVGFPLNRCIRELAAIFPDVGPQVPVSQRPATPQ